MKRVGNLNGFLALLVVFALLSGCSTATGDVSSTPPSGEGREISIVHSGWAESEAVATLSAVALEDEFGYETNLEQSTPGEAFEKVASGEADVFQGIWRPRHDDLVAEHEGEVEMLGGWLFGTTRASLAAPAYMDARTLSDLEGSGVGRALVLEPDASGVAEVPDAIFERYDLEVSAYADSDEMAEETGRLYENEEPFVMLAYSPHWMNIEYELDYLEDDVLEDVNRPQTLHSAARVGLSGEEPLARTFLAEMSLTENQVESLELAIREAGEPSEGARAWAATNDHLVRLWVSVARESAA